MVDDYSTGPSTARCANRARRVVYCSKYPSIQCGTMRKSDKRKLDQLILVPTAAQRGLLLKYHGSDSSVPEDVELSDETLDTLREIGAILETAVRRMEREGIPIPDSMYEKNRRNKAE